MTVIWDARRAMILAQQNCAVAVGLLVGMGWIQTGPTWLEEAVTSAPILGIGLGILFLVPILIAIGFMLRAPREAVDETQKVSRAGALVIDGVATEFAMTRAVAGQATLELEAPTEKQDTLIHGLDSGRVVRIGREDDNDVQIRLPTVHRYHAVVQHHAERGFEVTDLSGADGNGVLINGRRVQNARLRDRDQLTLGDAKFRFRLS